MRKSGSAVFLMELLVVILFFSLSAVVTLRLFITAYSTEQESARISRALLSAQSAAEEFRAKGPAMFDEGGWVNGTLPGHDSAYVYSPETALKGIYMGMVVGMDKTAQGVMYTGQVKVFDNNNKDKLLCTLDLAVYTPGEVSP